MKSVVRIRLVKTENPSACVTANWKVCRIAIALVLSVVPSCECIRCNKSNHPIRNPSEEKYALSVFRLKFPLCPICKRKKMSPFLNVNHDVHAYTTL
jgi:hypothetical protein